MHMKFIAHKSEDGLREQSLLEHLQGTSKLCGEFADAFGLKDVGECLGLYHDIGKYSEGFQHRIKDNGPKVDHASAGAQLLKHPMVAFCIAGHHSGLMNCGSKKCITPGTLSSRLNKKLIGDLDYSAYKKDLNMPVDLKRVFAPLQPRCFDKNGNFSSYKYMFLTRMLFSCLVDADYLDTEVFMNNGSKDRGDFAPWTSIYQKYQETIAKFMPDTPINAKRCEILQECLAAGKGDSGLYTLTVPTGGGKTIASLGFALEQIMQQKHPKKRIIYVIPYTSIIEQTADVFRDIVGEENVIEHHMNVDYNDDEDIRDDWKKLATENWDAPIIVTTNIQFFESLYANKTSRCRKLHNIADSVIIFDEAQMLPNDYLIPCMAAISTLVNDYGVTAVLCTATQPSLNKFVSEGLSCKEICHDIEGLYQFFRRVQYQLVTFDDISVLMNDLNEQKQVLCIVNSRKDAQKIFDMFKGDHCYHLSTFMCPVHRRKILAEIRQRLDNGEQCKVVATSLIEAGVDIDFPVVYREKAGLDSIIQAAGRCNRNGKNDIKNSVVKVFEWQQEGKKIPDYVKLPREVTNIICDKYTDIASAEAIKEYFDKLHNYRGETLDMKHIMENIDKNLPFAQIAGDFQLIKENGHNIFIPYDDKAQAMIPILRTGHYGRNFVRKANQYMITVYDAEYNQLIGTGDLEILDNISVLNNIEQYHNEKGLVCSIEQGIGVFA